MGFSGSSIENEKIGNRVCLRCSVRSKSISQVALSTTKKLVYRVPLRRLSRLLGFSKKRKIGNRVFFQCSVCLKSVYHVVLSKNGKIVSRVPLGCLSRFLVFSTITIENGEIANPVFLQRFPGMPNLRQIFGREAAVYPNGAPTVRFFLAP